MKGKILSIGMTVLLLSGMILVLSFGSEKKGERKVSDVKISIRYGGAEPLLSIGMISSQLNSAFGPLHGLPIGMVNVEAIQKELEMISAVKSAGVQIRPDGSVEIRVRQRKPLLQVLNSRQQHYFISDEGTVMLNPVAGSPSLPILTGYLNEGLPATTLNGMRCDTLRSGHALREVYDLGRAFQANPFVNSLIEQVFKTEEGNYELVPIVGPSVILIGRADNLDLKFRNIEAFYKNTYGRIDWSIYQSLDARFSNQIICIKKTPSI